MIIGSPGSGKSTFSKELSKKINLPLFHLDLLNWKSDGTTVDKSIFLEKLKNIIDKPKWIIDGNYNSSLEMRFEACDTVIFLDYDVETCINGVLYRRGKKRTDMPFIEPEENIDETFLNFVKSYPVDSKPAVLKLIEKYHFKQVYIFKSRDEAKHFLNNL
ncbi:hypothetical protein [Macrococcus sp. DPC7161]|uniref:hypothetical protein n=1 Tax=Macrococcus sp. DPC7161 TaxID=2507060 RepID=UPI00197C67A3|nr:hypothetical protein [Macrococcus sp. DPC7161]